MKFWTDWQAPVVQWLRSPPPTRRTRIRFPAGVEVFIVWTPAMVEIPSARFCVVWIRMSGGGGDYVRIVEHVVKLMPRGIAGS